MHGMRFLSAFLKVNPYFAIVMAVGFTGIAAIGVEQSDSVSLKNLIPLHIKSIFSKAPPDKIVTEVPGIEDAQQRIHELLQWSAVPMGDMNLRSALPALPPVADPAPWQERSLAALADPFGFVPWNITANQPGLEADKLPTDSPYQLRPAPSAPASGPEVNSPTPSGVVPRFTSPFPISPAIGSGEPEIPLIIAQPMIFAQYPLVSPLQDPDILLDIPPGDPPGDPGGGPSGSGEVPVAEPPAGFLFAGSLVVLAGLYRSGVQRRPARVVC